MSRVDGQGECAACGARFPYVLVHNGFNDTIHAYCDHCGRTALVSTWKFPLELDARAVARMPAAIEGRLAPCECRGRFTAGASPRCPGCRAELLASSATVWIERNAPGTSAGWRWPRSWQGLYAIVIADRVSLDPWIEAG
jgi:hypothetical protein